MLDTKHIEAIESIEKRCKKYYKKINPKMLNSWRNFQYSSFNNRMPKFEYYNISSYKRDKFKKEIQKQLDGEIIVETKSVYSDPCFIADKLHGVREY